MALINRNRFRDEEEDYDFELTQEAVGLVVNSILMEGLTMDELSDFLNSRDEIDSLLHEEITTERTIIKMDKKAHFNRNFMTSVFTVARSKKDRKFKKLVTLWKMEKILERDLIAKYGSQAKRLARDLTARARKSNSKSLKKAANNIKTAKSPNIKKIG